MELLDYWRLIRRYLWLVLALAVLVPALTVAAFYLLPRETKQATGRLLVTRGAMMETVAGPQGTETISVDPGAFIFALIAMIEGREVGNAVVKQLETEDINLAAPPTITAVKVAKANMIDVTARGQTPRQATAIVEAAMDEFKRIWEDGNRENATQTRNALVSRRDEALARLNQVDQRIQRFQSKYGIIDPVTELGALQATLGPLEQTQAEVTAALTDAQVKARQYGEEAKRQPPYSRPGITVLGNARREALRSQLWELQLQRTRLLEEYQEEAPEVCEVEAQINQVKAQLLEEPEAIPDPGLSTPANPYVESLEQGAFTAKVEVDSRRRHVELLQGLTEDRKQRIERLREAQTEYERLRAAREITSIMYQNLLVAVEQASTVEEQAAKKGMIRIQEQAQPVLRGGVGLGARLVGAIALGLILGIVVAIGVGYLDRSIRTEEDARTLLGQRVLVGIPRLDLTLPPTGPAPEEQPGGLRDTSGNATRSSPPDEPS